MRIGIQIQLVDDVQQAGAAENLLRDAPHPVLQIVVHVGRDVILRHGGLLHQNQRARTGSAKAEPSSPPTPSQPTSSGIRNCM